jgi:acyl-CoA synthetase (AMP-forming)/AMP-acid ligase II
MVITVKSSTQVHKPSTLVELLRNRAQQQPDQRAYTFLLDVEDCEHVFTYGQLDRRARVIAARLQSLGIAGERAILVYPSGLEYLAACFGCLYAMAVAVPAYPPNPTQLEKSLAALQNLVADARPTVVLTSSAVWEQLKQCLLQASEVWSGVRWLVTDTLGDHLASYWHEPVLTNDALALLQYTSGSTAAPKGVMLSHSNILHNQQLMQEMSQHSAESTYVNWLPLHHNLGLMGCVLQSLYVGSHCVLMAPNTFLQRPYRWLEAISRFRCRSSVGPNFAYELCIEKVSPSQRASLDLSSWDLALIGGEPVRPDVLERFSRTFAECGFHREAFFPGYGMAEVSLMIAAKRQGLQPLVRRFDPQELTAGRAVDSTDPQAPAVVGYEACLENQPLAIVHPETLRRCADGEIGEIWVSGGSVAQGYWNQPEKTTETFAAHLVGGEGPFLRTGDLGCIAEGKLFITGRLKDLIIIAGRNHYPQDIEKSVQDIGPPTQITACAAFAVPGSLGEEQLVVAVEVDAVATESEATVLTRTIQRAVAERHGLQATIVFLKPSGIARTAIGKIQRQPCRASYLSNALNLWEPQP